MSIEDTTGSRFLTFPNFSSNAFNRCVICVSTETVVPRRRDWRSMCFARTEFPDKQYYRPTYKYSNDDKSPGDNRSYPLGQDSIYLSAIHSETRRTTRNRNDRMEYRVYRRVLFPTDGKENLKRETPLAISPGDLPFPLANLYLSFR